MECRCIPYTRVPKASTLLVDYLYHFDRVSSYYSGSPFDLRSYQAIAGQIRSPHQDRRALTQILAKQNKALGCGEATLASIDRLSDPATLAVVTGQQVGLLSGPSFTLYKALTAVRLAQTLSDQGLPAVPVFWLATEDHDLEEVAETRTFNDDYEPVTLSDSGDRAAPRSSVGYVRLSTEINTTLERLRAALPGGEGRDHLLEDLRATYRAGAGWGEAFGKFMARLFSRWGVVLIDPLDEGVHNLSRGLYSQALTRVAELRECLQKRSQALVRDGYHAQVKVTDNSTLLFLTRQGNRLPLHHQGPGSRLEFTIEGADEVSLAELKVLIENRPIDLTPNALLRPIVQDTLLPTVAYVGGPSELAYLGQAQAIYPLLGRPMPIVFPRAGFTLVDRKVRRLMEKYRLSLEDAWKGEEHLSHRIAAAGFSEGGGKGWEERFDQTEQEFARLLGRLREDIQTLDPTLLDALKRAEEKITYQVERLKGKLSRAALERSELLGRHLQTVQRFLAPRKNLQEREITGPYFLACIGYDLLERLLAQIQTRTSDHQVVDY